MKTPTGGQKEELTMRRTPLLWIRENVWKELHWYARAFQEEVSGLGTLEVTPQGFWVKEIYLLKKGSRSTVEITETELGIFSDGLFRQGVAPLSLCFHWHSHGVHDVSWSQKDEKAISNFLCMAAFWVSVVVNGQGDILCRFDQERPIPLTFELTPRVVLEPLSSGRLTACRQAAEKLSPGKQFPKAFGPDLWTEAPAVALGER